MEIKKNTFQTFQTFFDVQKMPCDDCGTIHRETNITFKITVFFSQSLMSYTGSEGKYKVAL